jgi:LacI family transcriptional regulator
MIDFAPQIAPDTISSTVLRPFDGAPDENSIRRAGMNLSDPARLPRVALLIESSRTYGRGILRGIARYAHLFGPWSFFTVERDLHGGIPKELSNWRGDGIIARIEDRQMAARLLQLGCPVVDVLGQKKFNLIPSFDTDAVEVARMSVDFFLRAGFQHFAFIGYPGIPFSDARQAAFTRLLAERKYAVLVPPGIQRAVSQNNIQAVESKGIGAETIIARWLREQPHPLAVLACNDVRAQQVLNGCREHGLRVPEQIAVMGVDNDDVLCSLCEPPLSSIEPDTERIGYEAAELLAGLMIQRRAVRVAAHIPPARLIERTSTDVVAIDDPVTVQAVRFIRSHVNQGIAVKDVMAHVGRSRTDLELRFRRAFNSSVRREILRHRLERARVLLLETSLNLNKIAQQTGFSSAGHFCRLFQQHYRQLPTAYRRQC